VHIRLVPARRPVQAPHSDATPVPPVRAAAAVLTVVAVLAIAGAAIGVRNLAAHDPTVNGTPPFAGAWNADASFGPVRVEQVERVANDEFTGGHHTAQEKVDELRVSVEMANHLARRIPFSPGQFRVRLGAVTFTSVRPNPPPNSIGAGDTVRQQLTFVVPARRSAYTLLFDDLGRATPLTIALGSLSTARKD
jgi:hypothetical protein